MRARELAVPGVWEFSPEAFPDHRGRFVAPFQGDVFETTVGRRLPLGQVNHSVSTRGVIRGIHFADVPPGQAKYVYCPQGELLDVIVDIRVGSPAFGRSDAVRLDPQDCRAVYLPEGVGHAMMALRDDTVLCYLCSTGYNPRVEHGVDPLDPALALPWPNEMQPILSEKDGAAPTLATARDTGILPEYATCQRHYRDQARR